MERHSRKTQRLTISPELADILVRLRARERVDTPTELDVDKVRGVEAVIGGALPDPWLAVLAADVPALRDGLGLALGSIAAHTKQAHRSLVQRDFVALASDAGTYYGFIRGRDEGRIAILEAGERSLRSDALVSWLRSRFELPPVPAASTPFEVTLVRHVLPTDDGKQRVRHPQWGEGLVLAELGEGPTRKVKAEFPGRGLKVVQARFLQFIDPSDDEPS